MSEREWILFLNDINNSIEKILKFTKDLNKNQFKIDDKTLDAVLRNLEIIGEAVKNIPDEIKKVNSFIQWKQIAGLRDIVIHEYFGLDFDIIWDVIKNEIPKLKTDLKKITMK